MIGLGDIAEKAYLPVLAMRTDVALVLVTRNATALQRTGDRHRLRERYGAVEDAIAAGLDAAFVHTATEAHVPIVQMLLNAGISVFVDKPLSYRYADAAQLAAVALESGVGLMVGFNRRYAPAYRELSHWPERNFVIMEKHRTGPLERARKSVFDDFIHVVDTLRFLGPPVAVAAVTADVADGLLRHLSISLTDGIRSASGFMSRVAGHTEETLEVVAAGRKRRVVNMAETIDLNVGECLTRRDEWQSVGVQRGFAQMAETFIASLHGGALPDIQDALATHAMCEQIVADLESR